MMNFKKFDFLLGLLIVCSLLVTWPLFLSGYFSHHDDLQVMRIFEMRKCFLDFQIPCRWVPDMGYGNGFPLFNYYSAFPYYIGAIFSLFIGYINAAKILFLIPLILGGISMYLFSRELTSKRAAFFSGLLYVFAPYRALDSYVRGAVAESFALSIIPLVFYFCLKALKGSRLRDILGLALSLFAFLLSHNIMTLLFFGELSAFVVLVLFLNGIRNTKKILLGLVLGIGLSAFFILPAFFEKSLVQSENLTKFDLDFRVHFVTVKQLFERNWGYGASVLGPNDTISFQVGWPHWLVILGILLILGLKKLRVKNLPYIIFFLSFFLVSIFMMHNKSSLVWERLNLLQYAQFPWRFLSISIFSVSILGAFFIDNILERLVNLSLIILSILTIFLNFAYFKPKEFYFYLTDQEKLSGKLWEEQQKAAIFDYLPKTAIESREKAQNNPILIKGEAVFRDFENKSNRFRFNSIVKSPSRVEIPVYDFPNWTVFVNGKEFPHDHKNLIGRVALNLPEGNFNIEGKFLNTNIRTFSNLLTLVSFVFLCFLIVYRKKIDEI